MKYVLCITDARMETDDIIKTRECIFETEYLSIKGTRPSAPVCVWACVYVSLQMAHICSRMSKCVTALSPALIAFMSVTQNPFYFRVSSAHCVSVLVVANVGGAD